MLRVLLAFTLAFAAVGATRADEETLELGRELTADFQKGRMQELWDRMTEEMRQAIGGPDALGEVRATLDGQSGAEAAVLAEDVTETQGLRVYQRIAEHTEGDAPIVTQFALDADGRIAGFFVRPQAQAAASRFLEYQTKTLLRLPFEGEWHVYWGGRTPEQNYHAVDPGQRFAYDFNVQRDGASHAGEPGELSSYFCWDQPVLAPADAVVAAAVDGLPDQEIGERDPQNPAGNHVVLDFGGEEYAFLAHLRQGSVTVRRGDEIVAGAELGRCGNSGNTSEPHLHFHLQTTPVLGDGEGLPAFFEDYIADGSVVERGEPVKGQIVSPADSD
jgi:hypothetical protein